MGTMRVAVVWQIRTSYVSACLEAVVAQGAEVCAWFKAGAGGYEFDHPEPAFSTRLNEPSRLLTEIRAFAPDIVLFCGWSRENLRVAYKLRGQATRLLHFDNQFHRSAKQLVATTAGRRVLASCFDYTFVPGGRQARYAKLLGFPSDRILLGSYAGDVQLFDDRGADTPDRAGFAFVGRLVPEKGVHDLALAIEQVDLLDDNVIEVLGGGPLEWELAGRHGVQLHGFSQPQTVARVLSSVGCLILPSHFEPWGVVVHEAALAGCALILTDKVGAGDDFLRHGENGWLVQARDPEGLAGAMSSFAQSDSEWRSHAGTTSRHLAASRSPRLFAERLLATADPALRPWAT